VGDLSAADHAGPDREQQRSTGQQSRHDITSHRSSPNIIGRLTPPGSDDAHRIGTNAMSSMTSFKHRYWTKIVTV
jgi:hypothetical protein